MTNPTEFCDNRRFHAFPPHKHLTIKHIRPNQSSPLLEAAFIGQTEEFWTGFTGFTGWEAIPEAIANVTLPAPR
jgi:hypothetical protein